MISRPKWQEFKALRGRKPKPTNLKVIQGNPGKRALPKGEPKPEAALPPCPGHLSDVAKLEWARLSRELYRLGLLSNIDRNALATYCQAYGRWVAAEGAIAELAKSDPITGGLMIRTRGGNAIQNPLVGTANRAMEIMNKIAAEFGMTPSSRARVAADQGKSAIGKDEEDAAAFFGD